MAKSPLRVSFEDIVLAVAKERAMQEKKWGEQHYYAQQWFTVLLEEIGEVAENINKGVDYDYELIQAAAVIFAWLEDDDRTWRPKR